MTTVVRPWFGRAKPPASAVRPIGSPSRARSGVPPFEPTPLRAWSRRSRARRLRWRWPRSLDKLVEIREESRQIHPLLPTRRRSSVDRSLVAGGARRQWLQACLPDGHTTQCLFSPCLRVSKSVIKKGSCNSGSGTGQSPCRRSPARVLPRERKQPGTRRSRDSEKKSTAG